MNPQAFIKLLEPYAQKAQAKYGLPWQVMIAQAALETGWLSHITKDKYTGKDSHNLFNIKWTGQPDYVVSDTTEYINGKRVKLEAKFRMYKDFGESFDDYCKFIIRIPRYKAALAVKGDPVKYAQALQKAGYATDPNYAAKLIAIIRKYCGVK